MVQFKHTNNHNLVCETRIIGLSWCSQVRAAERVWKSLCSFQKKIPALDSIAIPMRSFLFPVNMMSCAVQNPQL